MEFEIGEFEWVQRCFFCLDLSSKNKLTPILMLEEGQKTSWNAMKTFPSNVKELTVRTKTPYNE